MNCSQLCAQSRFALWLARAYHKNAIFGLPDVKSEIRRGSLVMIT